MQTQQHVPSGSGEVLGTGDGSTPSLAPFQQACLQWLSCGHLVILHQMQEEKLTCLLLSEHLGQEDF